MDPNPYKSPTSNEPAKPRGPLARMNEAMGFGFGLIDNWVFIYAGGTMLSGIGCGMLITEFLRTRQLRLDSLVIAAICCR